LYLRLDHLYVANIDGYLGKSAATEAAYARLKGLPIITAEEIKTISDEIPLDVQHLIREGIRGSIPIDAISREKLEQLEREAENKPDIELTPEELQSLSRTVVGLIRELSSQKG